MIKKGLKVRVLTGKDKKKEGEVIEIDRANNRAKVKEINGPSVIEFVVEQHDMVYPMVPAGANLDEMISRPVHEQFEDAEM